MNDPSNLNAPEKRPIFQLWIDSITKPTVENYEAIAADPGTSIGNAAIWLFIALVIGGFVGGLFGLMFNSNMLSQFGTLINNLPPDSQEALRSLFSRTGGSFVGVVCGAPIGAVFGLFFYFIGLGIQHWLAQLFGGVGVFEKFFALNATFYTPIALVTGVLANIPLISCLGVLISFYAVYLNFLSLRAVHKLTSGKAVTVILIPVLIACLLAACIVFFGLAMLIPILRQTNPNTP
jgi:Yip1-like protein